MNKSPILCQKGFVNTIRGFMDLVDWEEEAGNASGGVRVYPSKKDLEKFQPCVAECGIVQVEITEYRTVRKQCFDFTSDRWKGPKPPSKLRKQVVDRKDARALLHAAQQLSRFSEADRKIVLKLAKEMEEKKAARQAANK